jgi:hypothetical protein
VSHFPETVASLALWLAGEAVRLIELWAGLLFSFVGWSLSETELVVERFAFLLVLPFFALGLLALGRALRSPGQACSTGRMTGVPR